MNYLPFILVTLVLSMLVGLNLLYEERYPYVCTNEVTVASILSVNNKDIAILTTTGVTLIVYKSELSPGDKFCHKWERKK